MRLTQVLFLGITLLSYSCSPLEEGAIGYEVGNTAPNIALQTIDQKAMDLQQFRGSYLIVEFWASWCGPCHKELPQLISFYNEQENLDIDILSIALEKKADSGLKFSEQMNFPWSHQVVHETRFVRFDSAAQAFGVSTIPASFLIDPKGKVLASHASISEIRSILSEINS